MSIDMEAWIGVRVSQFLGMHVSVRIKDGAVYVDTDSYERSLSVDVPLMRDRLDDTVECIIGSLQCIARDESFPVIRSRHDLRIADILEGKR